MNHPLDETKVHNITDLENKHSFDYLQTPGAKHKKETVSESIYLVNIRIEQKTLEQKQLKLCSKNNFQSPKKKKTKKSTFTRFGMAK